MSKKSADSKVVIKSAKEIPPASQADLDRLRNAMNVEIDTSEIPEGERFERLTRDSSGILPRRKSIIREAVERRRKSQRLTVYRLWQRARVFHPTLSQAAVHEFLKGQRQLELPSAEALLIAVDLRIVRKVNAGRPKVARTTKARSSKRVR